MTALDDHYTTLSNNKTERKNEIENETKIENTNNRKAEYEEAYVLIEKNKKLILLQRYN